MKHFHATFTHVMTYVRIMALLVFSLFFVILIPFLGVEAQDFLKDNLGYLGFLYAILMGFLMSIAIIRRRELDEYIDVELNKIRRIYHIALHLTKQQPRFAPWLKELKEDLDAYLSMFREVSFYVYERGNDLFRNVTYKIYELPSLNIPYNVDLYRDLLRTAGKTTEARQRIRSKKNQYIGYFQWTVILIVTFTFAWILTSATPEDSNARIITGIIIFNIFLVLDLLYEYDRFNDKKLKFLANMYANNLTNVEEYKPNRKKKTDK